MAQTQVLKDKVAVITGGGRGIGKEFALRFAAEGAKVMIPDISLDRAESAAKEINAQGGKAVATHTDISDEASTAQMAKDVVKHFGRADILINNAAIWYGLNITPWNEWKAEDWDRIFSVNVKGSWLCAKALAPIMTKGGGGRIINIASNVARVPAAQFFLPYACSKGAVYTLTHALARALAPSGINVNAIAPGYTASEASLTQRDSEMTFKIATGEQSIQRRLEPGDMVETALFLASPGAALINGQVIFVDAGTVML